MRSTVVGHIPLPLMGYYGTGWIHGAGGLFSLKQPFYILVCRSGAELGHEMALELVCGAGFSCIPHHFSTPIRGDGSAGEVWPET